MAASSKEAKEKRLALSLKNRLDALGCPYTADVDQTFIKELLFKPGEPRIRILQWLFCKFDEDLSVILDMECATVESRMNSRLQRLLHVASTLGLCQYDDVDLIKGVTGGAKQCSFLDQLLDIVSIADAAEDPQTKAMIPRGIVSDACSLETQLEMDRNYMDKLVSQEKLDVLFNSSITLLPPDIARQVERDWVKRGFTPDKPPLPEPQSLSENYNDLVDNLQRQAAILKELKSQCSQESSGDSDVMTVSRTLSLALSELSQLMTGFMYCFENEIQPWCNKSPPQLTQLGAAVKRVHTLLSQLKIFQDSLRSIRISHDALNAGSRPIVEPLQQQSMNSLLMSSNAENFPEYISVLEESIHREASLLSTRTN